MDGATMTGIIARKAAVSGACAAFGDDVSCSSTSDASVERWKWVSETLNGTLHNPWRNDLAERLRAPTARQSQRTHRTTLKSITDASTVK